MICLSRDTRWTGTSHFAPQCLEMRVVDRAAVEAAVLRLELRCLARSWRAKRTAASLMFSNMKRTISRVARIVVGWCAKYLVSCPRTRMYILFKVCIVPSHLSLHRNACIKTL